MGHRTLFINGKFPERLGPETIPSGPSAFAYCCAGADAVGSPFKEETNMASTTETNETVIRAAIA